MNNKTIAVAVAGAAGLVLSMTSVAFAQEAGAQGGVSAQASVGAPPLPPAQAAPAAAPAPVYAAAPVVHEDEPDHERFVGHFAVGYFGVSQLPIAGIAGTALGTDTVNAPVVGVRYWLQRNLGLDLGIGIGYSGGSTEVVNGGTTVSTDKTTKFGAAFHGGVPLAFAHGRHYSFLVIPEATVGFTSGTIKATTPNGVDTDISGFKLDLGGRIGAEIHFGFIGIPELSLEGSVGVFVSREAIKAKQDQNSASDGTTKFGTSVQSDPWALFVNNISAFYYF